jgi:signal peptide peptidase SppA
VDELSTEIFNARAQKKVVAVSNTLAASAAYYIASAAEEFIVTPSGEAGSIGVYAMHLDFSKQNDMTGVGVEYVSAGKYKVEGNPDQPLSDEARAAMQSRVNDYYNMFVKAVARNRNVKVDDVRNGFGEGRVVGAREAVKLGMADRIATLDQTLARFGADPSNTRTLAAEADEDALVAEGAEPPPLAAAEEPAVRTKLELAKKRLELLRK